jgi:hypothetical protein
MGLSHPDETKKLQPLTKADMMIEGDADAGIAEKLIY